MSVKTLINYCSSLPEAKEDYPLVLMFKFLKSKINFLQYLQRGRAFIELT